MIQEIFEHVGSGGVIGSDDAMKLARDYSWEELAPYSEKLTRQIHGNRISICTILNAKSGACDMNCSFCSQSSVSKAGTDVYPLVPNEKIQTAFGYAEECEAECCGLVTSGGRLNDKDVSLIGQAILEHKGKGGVNVCGSFGRLNRTSMSYLKECGLTRVHHNLETSRDYYPNICTTQSWDARLDTVKEALEMGFDVCCGGLFGIGESWRDRVDLALTLRKLEIRSVPMNFLVPYAGTHFEGRDFLSPDEALKIISIFRFLLPEATIRVCGGRMLIPAERQADVFRAGATGIMTGHYLTIDGFSPREDLDRIQKLGLQTKTELAGV